MKRTDVINAILNKKGGNQTYLEIGVSDGRCFFSINANRKIAVDPVFQIKPKTYWKVYGRKPLQWFNDSFFSISSNEFFESKVSFLKRNKPSVIFIDGLHTYEQSLDDAINSLNVVNDGGVIVMHDCNPPNAASAHPAASYEEAKSLDLGQGKAWCGDVWKAIVYLQTLPNLEVFVLNTDFGLGIIRKKFGNKSRLTLSEDVISSLTYSDLCNDREALINLKNLAYFDLFQETLT